MSDRAIRAATIALVSCASGCVSAAPPPELVAARMAYEHALASEAPSLAPAALESAKTALTRAERAASEGESEAVASTLGYVAAKRALTAEALAGVAAAERQRIRAETEIEKGKAEMREHLATQTHTRQDAVHRAEAALDELSRFARVDRGPHQIVISIAGSSLFPEGSAELTPNGQENLAATASAIHLERDKRVIVEGHADAPPGLELARQRAEIARDFLVDREVTVDRIRAAADPPHSDGAESSDGRVDILLEPNDDTGVPTPF